MRGFYLTLLISIVIVKKPLYYYYLGTIFVFIIFLPFQHSERLCSTKTWYMFLQVWCWRSIWLWFFSWVDKHFVPLSECGTVCKKIQCCLRFRRQFFGLFLFFIRRWVLSPPWLVLWLVLALLAKTTRVGVIQISSALSGSKCVGSVRWQLHLTKYSDW